MLAFEANGATYLNFGSMSLGTCLLKDINEKLNEYIHAHK